MTILMKHLLVAGITFAAVTQLAVAASPEGWFVAGSKPANYDTGVDQDASYNGLKSAFLKAKADQEGFGTLMQSFSATNYLGKRVRLSGYVKSEDVTRWAGLWARVDGSGSPPKVLAFDNMQTRPVKGTTAWQRYEVVLDVPDVPDSAVGIALGILLDGPGEVWLNGTEFEIVSSTIPATSNKVAPPDSPRNLNFSR
jgi:hypothetical protein